MTRAFMGAVVAALTASALAAAPSAAAVRMTHTLTMEGELVNRWAVTSDDGCTATGDGTLTVKFKSVRPARVFPHKDRFTRGEVGGLGAWIIGSLLPPNVIRDMPAQPVTGTISRVDNTAQHPPTGEECESPSSGKAGCGTRQLSGRSGVPRAVVQRWSPRQTSTGLNASSFVTRSCHSGSATDWADRDFAGKALLLDMPKPSAFRTRRVVRLTETSRKRASDDLGSEVVTNDVTRRFTATFRRR